MKENIRILYPKYLKEFKCSGGKCEDNCCNGWEIHIDKNSFNMYENIRDKKMNKFVNKNIYIRDKCKHFDLDYGQIKLRSNNNCPFLSVDKYCIIQSELGEEYLSNVCTTFPRIINKVDDYYEISLDVSCIEAARIVLLSEDVMKFEESETMLGKYALTMKFNTNSNDVENTNYKYLKEIRNKSIEILQNRRYMLDERLYMLGVFLEITRRQVCYNYNNANEFIIGYNIDSYSGKFKRNKENYMIQLSFYRDMLEKLNFFELGKSEYFNKKINEATLGFKFNEHGSLMDNSEIYLKAYSVCEENIFKKYNYIFENYLVNHVFNELFPFSESDMMINDYIMLLVRFSYIRFYIVGQYLYNGEMSKEDIVRSIQSLIKEIEHNKTYLKDILRYIKENGLDNERFCRILL